MLAKSREGRRCDDAFGELLRKRFDRVAIDVDGLQEPALLLMHLAEPVGHLELPAHRSHGFGEPPNGGQHAGLLEVTHRLMPVPDGRDPVKRGVEQRRQLVLLAPRQQRREHLIEMEITEESRLWCRLDVTGVAIEQDAVELHGNWAA